MADVEQSEEAVPYLEHDAEVDEVVEEDASLAGAVELAQQLHVEVLAQPKADRLQDLVVCTGLGRGPT